jgi:hypothetical protein
VVELPERDGPRTLFIDTVGVGEVDYERNRVVLDRMARTLDLGAEGREGVVASYGGVAELAVAAEATGDEVCLSIVGDAERVCVPVPDPDGGRLHTAVLPDIDPVLAGVTSPQVFRVMIDLRGGGTSSVLPAPVPGSDSGAFAVLLDVDEVERFHLLDLTGSVVEVVEPGA